jgi:hypothetical protein
MKKKVYLYKICTEKDTSGLWYWSVHYDGDLVDEARNDWAQSTYAWFRWSAKRKARKAAGHHAYCKRIVDNPQRECEEYIGW